MVSSSLSWEIESKAPSMSASRTHFLRLLGRAIEKILEMASWQERPGLKP